MSTSASSTKRTKLRLALICFHSCPVGRLGEKNTGGMNVYVRQLARELAAQGNQVDVFTRTHELDEPQIVPIADGARVIHLDAGPPDAPKEDLDSHYWLSGVVAIELSRRWNAPHIATFHTLARTKQRARAGERESERRAHAEHQIIDTADSIVVSTHIEKDDIARLYGANGTPLEVIPPGVDTALFQPMNTADARRELDLPDKRTILYVGRIEPLKGLDILLKAVALLNDTANTHLLIVGGSLEKDAELERLNTLAVNLGISDIVTFIGSVKQEQLPAYYSASDVFVLPSWYESFGLVALEAMSCGTPVVVSRVGGLKTFVENGKTGYLVPWRCPEPFAQSLETLLENPSLRRAMGSAARRKAMAMSWTAMATKMLACYHKNMG
ncbi:D-inositol 3-phosphate glycosyltransferase [Geodia barretti]|uniref:D-inositol 3-phosphate glycosyltransferase n=1 Tax=Geodia barretti TaxID=519541 RepID=A0AA35RAT6_GEOBA|nr:D-inositol 3-phosphate glycosyltransferase [Geodia barretti]